MKRAKRGGKQNRMLKKLQHKFVGIAIISLVTIVFVELFSVNLVNIYQQDSDARSLLLLIAENDGVLPGSNGGNTYNALWNPFGRSPMTSETKYSTRYFVVKLHENVVMATYTQNISSVDTDTAFRYAQRIYDSDRGFGFIDLYRYYYASDPDTGNSIMVFLDFEKQMVDSLTLASISFLVGLLCVVLLSFPVYLLSKNALRPVRRSIEQQKQFITDAGHELKTPLAIISADVDVLEMCEGENEWLDSIKSQTQRMDALVKDLVQLSKLDEIAAESEHLDFSLSDAVLDTAMDFAPVAKSKELQFDVRVQPQLQYKGNEGELRQLVSILCDNAVKYCAPQGQIIVSLYKSGKNICLDVYNDCEQVEREKLPRLFDRFYRADTSRSRETGGYGIGLSVAKAIVTRHKGKITASTEDEKSILFHTVL